MKTKQEFLEFFETSLRPDLDVLELERKKVLRNCLIAGGAGAAIAIPVALYNGLYGIIPAACAVVAIGIMLGVGSGSIRKKFKNNVMSKIAAFAGDDLTYLPTDFVPQHIFLSSGLVSRSIDRYNGEDMISGQIGKTAFMCSEVHAEHRDEHTDSKGNRHVSWTTLFKGLYFLADFNKSFAGHTVVLPDMAERLLGSVLGRMLQKANFTMPGKLVKLEDPEFEKLFVVYSENEIECRYILSLSLMQRLVEFANKAGKKVMISFINSNIHVAIPMTRNLFEPKLFSPVNSLALLEGIFDDICFVLGIIDDLNLNTRIWSKE